MWFVNANLVEKGVSSPRVSPRVIAVLVWPAWAREKRECVARTVATAVARRAPIAQQGLRLGKTTRCPSVSLSATAPWMIRSRAPRGVSVPARWVRPARSLVRAVRRRASNPGLPNKGRPARGP